MSAGRTIPAFAALAASVLALCLAAGQARALANPASVHCVNLGGTLEIRTGPGGGQYGVCIFEDNRQCEEWALFRGECPAGGVKITGYLDGTPEGEARAYCAIRGGKLTSLETPTATCELPGRKPCLALDAFRHTCP